MPRKRSFASVVIATALASVIAMLAVATTNADTIGYWRFEGDDAGFVADSSGNGFTLTKGDGSDPATYPQQYTLPSSGAAGEYFDDPIIQNDLPNSKAADFDDDAYFSYADNPMFSVSDFTIEAYINRRNANECPEVIAGQWAGTAGGVSNQRSWSMGVGSGSQGDEEFYMFVNDSGASSGQQIIYSGLKVPLNTDCYVAISFDESEQTGGITFYMKNLSTGEWQTSTKNHTIDTLYDSICPLQIGAYGGDSVVRNWDGMIDEVRWSNSVLAQDELLAFCEAVPGDADFSGSVDMLDAAILAANWLTGPGASWGQGDFNDDGFVNEIDATMLAVNWSEGNAASVPEPSSLVVLVCCIFFATAFSVRRRLS